MPTKSEFPPLDLPNEAFPPRLLSALWRHFADDPARLALVNARQQEDSVTFGELYVLCLSTAAFLRQTGFGPGQVACLVLPNCWEYVPIFVGAGLCGGAISGANPLLTEHELQRQLLDSRSQVVFCAEANLDTVKRAVHNAPSVQTIVCVDSGRSKKPLPTAVDKPQQNLPGVRIVRFGQVLRTEPILPLAPLPPCSPHRDVLLLPYSSGTTGLQKGVRISHSNWGAMLCILIDHFERHIHAHLVPPFHPSGQSDLLLLPFFHCYGFALLIMCLLNGSTGLVMAVFEPQLFCRTVQDFRIRTLKIVPPILVFLAKNPIVDTFDLSPLHFILSGAAPAGPGLCERLRRRLPSLQHVAQGYGMTEMTVATHLPVLGTRRPAVDESSGKLVANLEQKIVDIETGEEVEQGMPGELHLRGPTVMLGYLGRPRETAAMVDQQNGGWLGTGDIVFMDNQGCIHVVDRRKELIKVNGLQVAPAELEDLLLSHPDVADCAVVGVPDEIAGELPKAFVVRRAGATVDRAGIQQFVTERAVYYKRLKGGVEFVSEIPKSAAGKILRRLLRRGEGQRPAGKAKTGEKGGKREGNLSKL